MRVLYSGDLQTLKATCVEVMSTCAEDANLMEEYVLRITKREQAHSAE